MKTLLYDVRTWFFERLIFSDPEVLVAELTEGIKGQEKELVDALRITIFQ